MRFIHWLLLAGLVAAQGAAAQPGSDFVIRVYEVPVEHQQTIEAVLGEAVSLALGLEQRSRGVSSPGQGQIVVTAPARIHADIERFLRDFQPTEIASLRTEYWIVRGEPGAGVSLPPQLEPISEVLESISAASSEMSYSLEDQVEILSRASGGHAAASFRNGELEQQLDYVGGKIVGEFQLNYTARTGNRSFRDRQFATEIAVTPGQYIVLGRIGLDWGLALDAEDNEGENRSPTNLFVILRSQLAD